VLYRAALRRDNVLQVSLMTAAAMLAICLLALVETTNTAEAKDSLPENGKIAFESFPPGRAGRIYTVEPDGSNVRQLIPGAGAPKWSPDGTEIICTECSVGDATVMRADGSNMRTITNRRGLTIFGGSPTWSADGTSVAFSDYQVDMQRGQSNDMDIFMLDLDTSKQTTLRRTPKLSETYADFSPDGSQICFFHDDTELPIPGDKPMGVYVMDVHGSDPPRLLAEGSGPTCDWSPDGKKIVLNTYGGTSIINADGSGRTDLLTGKSAAYINPAWSPDGTKIVFSSDRDGGDYDLYTMDTDGSDVAQVTNLPGDEHTPDWQPLTPKSRTMTVHQPDTGGPSLLLVAIALLFSGGVMFYAGLKRRM
jgi:Tol biopolymer transport system component